MNLILKLKNKKTCSVNLKDFQVVHCVKQITDDRQFLLMTSHVCYFFLLQRVQTLRPSNSSWVSL